MFVFAFSSEPVRESGWGRTWVDGRGECRWMRATEWVSGWTSGHPNCFTCISSLRARRSLRSRARAPLVLRVCACTLRAARTSKNKFQKLDFQHFPSQAPTLAKMNFNSETGFSAFSATGPRTSENELQNVDFHNSQPQAPELTKIRFRSWIFNIFGHRRQN